MGKFYTRISPTSLFILLFVINLTLSVACQNDSTRKIPPKAIDGVLDLRNWDFEKDGPVDLAGEWEFYWGEHFDPKDFSVFSLPAKTGFIDVPGSWNGYLVGSKRLSGYGYATYRLKILKNNQSETLAFKLLDINTVFTIYVNGEKLSSAGVVGKSFKTTVPGFFLEVLDFVSEANQVEIILHVSNFHHRLGGPWETIELGTEKDIRKARERSLFFDIFLLGSILFVSLYHLCLYFLRKKDKSLLYFGIFCSLIGFRLLVTGERYLINLFPFIGWEIAFKIEYLSFYLAIPLFAMFIHSIFHQDISKLILRIIQLLAILFSLIVIIMPTKIYSHTLYAYQILTFMSCAYGIYVLVISLVRRREGSVLFSIGFFLLFITVINDILYSRMMIQTGYLVQFGLFSFIFFQAFLLARRYSAAFNTVEIQSQELTEINKAYVNEIKERKHTESLLRDNEERLKLVFDYAPDGYYLLDFEGRFLNGNKMAEKISGYNKEELIGKRFHEVNLLEPNELAKAIDILIKCTQGLYSGPEELILQRKNGDTLQIEISVHPIKIKHQNVILGIARDVTEKKKLELQLGQAQKMKAIGNLAGGIAHDFNNLLMAINGYNSLMKLKTDTSHPNYNYITKIETSIESAVELTKQLLGFAKGGKYEVNPTDLNELIKNQNRMYGRTKREVLIKGKYDNNLWSVEVDKGQIEQVLMNIYINAFQAMPNGGHLYIQTQNVEIEEENNSVFEVTPGNYVNVSITDTGIGMDEETKKQIFDPFFTTKEKERGTGMGLSSAYGIIKNHGGFITVFSEPGEGSTFNIFLPASDKKVVNQEKHIGSLKYGSGTILFIDDEQVMREVGEEMLNLMGYDVLTAKNGNEGIEIYRKNKEQIDLVILDMIMPGTTGVEVYDGLKNINHDIKVLLSSGYSIDSKANEIMERGCNGFLQKPFNMEQFSQKINEVLSQ